MWPELQEQMEALVLGIDELMANLGQNLDLFLKRE